MIFSGSPVLYEFHKKTFKFNIKSPIFTNAPCKTACLYNAPSMHTLDHIRNYYLSNSKTFQDGSGNGNLGNINSNDFQDGNWESMEMKV